MPLRFTVPFTKRRQKLDLGDRKLVVKRELFRGEQSRWSSECIGSCSKLAEMDTISCGLPGARRFARGRRSGETDKSSGPGNNGRCGEGDHCAEEGALAFLIQYASTSLG